MRNVACVSAVVSQALNTLLSESSSTYDGRQFLSALDADAWITKEEHGGENREREKILKHIWMSYIGQVIDTKNLTQGVPTFAL